MKEIGDRISELIEYLGISKNEFAKKIGISSSLISQITTKKNNFRADILQKIISNYEDLNTKWLLSGIGDMWEGSYKINGLGLRVENNKGSDIDTYRQENKQIIINSIDSISEITTFSKKLKFWNDLRKVDPKLDNTFTEIGQLIDNLSNLQTLVDEINLQPNRIDNEIDSLEYKTINSLEYKKKILNELEELKNYHDLILNLNHGINSVLLFKEDYTAKSSTHKKKDT